MLFCGDCAKNPTRMLNNMLAMTRGKMSSILEEKDDDEEEDEEERNPKEGARPAKKLKEAHPEKVFYVEPMELPLPFICQKDNIAFLHNFTGEKYKISHKQAQHVMEVTESVALDDNWMQGMLDAQAEAERPFPMRKVLGYLAQYMQDKADTLEESIDEAELAEEDEVEDDTDVIEGNSDDDDNSESEYENAGESD